MMIKWNTTSLRRLVIKIGPRGMLVYHTVMRCIVAATTVRMFKQHNRRLIASSPMYIQVRGLGDVNCEVL